MIEKHWLFTPGHKGYKPRHWRTPGKLYSDFQDYVELCQSNPITPKIPRPLTVRGFCIHTRVSRNTYYHLLKEPPTDDMGFAIEMVNDAIVNQKIELAVAGIFKEGIVSRLCGLVETVNQSLSTTKDHLETYDLSSLTDKELEEMMKLVEKTIQSPA